MLTSIWYGFRFFIRLALHRFRINRQDLKLSCCRQYFTIFISCDSQILTWIFDWLNLRYHIACNMILASHIYWVRRSQKMPYLLCTIVWRVLVFFLALLSEHLFLTYFQKDVCKGKCNEKLDNWKYEKYKVFLSFLCRWV